MLCFDPGVLGSWKWVKGGPILKVIHSSHRCELLTKRTGLLWSSFVLYFYFPRVLSDHGKNHSFPDCLLYRVALLL